MENDVLEELTDALEMYIKVIHQIEQEQESATVSEIAQKMGVKPPSVTDALRRLAEQGLISYEPYRAVNLTKRGREVAEGLEATYLVLKQFFMLIGVNEHIAEADACKIEHMIHPETFKRIYQFIKDESRRSRTRGR